MSSDPDRQKRYETVLSVVEHNTSDVSGPQRPGMEPHAVAVIAGVNGPWSAGGVRSSIRAALEQDDLVAYQDGSGQRRLARNTVDGLEAVLAHHDAGETVLPASTIGDLEDRLRELRSERA